MAARITSLVVGAWHRHRHPAEKANVAHLVALAFAVASSGNLPVVVLSLFWKFNTAGVISAWWSARSPPSAWLWFRRT